MAVRRYRDIAELAVPGPCGSPAAGLRAAIELSALCRWLGSADRPRGVQRFPTITDESRTQATFPR